MKGSAFMKARDLEFDPMDYYDKYLKTSIPENASKYFDDLVKKTHTDVNKNDITAQNIRKWEIKDKEGEKKLGLFKGLRVFLIIVAVILLVVAIISILACVNSDSGSTVALVLAIISPIVAVVIFVICFTILKTKIDQLKKEDEFNNKKLQELYSEARQELALLYDAFDEFDFDRIVKQTTDIFSIDPVLKPEKLLMLRDLYGLKDEPNIDESIVQVASGDIATNPYIRVRLFQKAIHNQTYTGSITISWSEWVSDGRGGGHTVVRTQVLTASISQPAPFYSNGTYVIYGNEACPDLTFSRFPSGVDPDISENDLRKLEIKTEKHLAKMSRESISKGGSFTPLANSKFEGLFKAYDRNNDVEFRTLFSALAQQNMCELILRKEPYGDDFSFFKRKKINIVSSNHGKRIPPYNCNAFYDYYDNKEMKKAFVKAIKDNFDSMFFELAPILCIPLYQQTDAGYFDVKEHYQHVSTYDAEAFANSMSPQLFMPDAATTPQVLKVNFNHSVGDTDFFTVNSYAYQGVPQVTYVSKMGGDGHMHDIPVQWTRYDPVSKTSTIGVREFIGDKKQFRNLSNDADFKNFNNLYASSVKNHNFLGFFAQNDYNYSQEEDAKVSSLVKKYLNIKREVD